VTGQGTTNVDFNAGMRAALAQIRDSETTSLAVGKGEVSLLRNADQIVERKVPLPARWLKGFVEVQAYQSRMQRRFSLDRTEAFRFLRRLPHGASHQTIFWILPSGRGFRLTQRECPEGVRVAGLERLRLLENLVPYAQGLTVFADPSGEASEWQLHFGPMNFHLAISADIWRGFSGEGQVLTTLAAKGRDRLLENLRGTLQWQEQLRVEEFMANWDVPRTAVEQALARLGSQGLVGYDLARGAYFHRELPFDLAKVEALQPRLKNARRLLAQNGVKIVRQDASEVLAEVSGTDVVHRVRLRGDQATCTCPWHARHQGHRGPCKHILAARIFIENLPS
jgi:hypothetical protein